MEKEKFLVHSGATEKGAGAWPLLSLENNIFLYRIYTLPGDVSFGSGSFNIFFGHLPASFQYSGNSKNKAIGL